MNNSAYQRTISYTTSITGLISIQGLRTRTYTCVGVVESKQSRDDWTYENTEIDSSRDVRIVSSSMRRSIVGALRDTIS